MQVLLIIFMMYFKYICEIFDERLKELELKISDQKFSNSYCENSIIRLMDELKYINEQLEDYINYKNGIIANANCDQELKEQIEKVFSLKIELEKLAKQAFDKKLEYTFLREEPRNLLEVLNDYMYRINDQIYNFEQKYKVINIVKNAEIIKFNNKEKTWTSHSTYSNIYNLLNPFGNVDVILDNDQNLNECWKTDGNEGVFSLKTENQVQPFAFAFTHKLNDNSNTDSIRNFTIYGLHHDEIWQWDFLGTYFFIIEEEEVTYVVSDHHSKNVKIEKNGDYLKEYFICSLSNCQNKYQYFRIEFQNSGSPLHTCIYRFELFIET